MALGAFRDCLKFLAQGGAVRRDEVAQAKLNICAVLSKTGRHRKAKEFAQQAVKDLHGSKDSNLLDVAYYNLGVENEYLHRYSNAQKAFTRSALG